MAVYFAADTHFGDRHIMRQRGTRFDTIEAHDSTLIARWNAIVGPEDEIWHLGDFAGEIDRAACAELFGRLNGRKRLVRGNHDSNRILELPWAEPPVDTLRLTLRDTEGREHKLFFSHYPHRSWPGLWRGTRHLYGHTHGRLADTRRSCDVGVDAWDFSPIGLDAILRRQDEAATWPEELAHLAGAEAQRETI